MPVVGPRVGLAYAAYVPALIRRAVGLVDYVEIAFERLRHEPDIVTTIDGSAVILHCASLSIGGLVAPAKQILRDITYWSERTATPWIGEHLAFVTALGMSGEVVDVGYTVAPPLNGDTLQRVTSAIARYQDIFGRPIILENPPQYFATPDSTMSQFEFISELCGRSDVEILLDLSHLLITSRNTKVEPNVALRALPLERVREIHLSGVRNEMNTHWDDHGEPAPKEVFRLLRNALKVSHPSAITLEYNWSAAFPESVVVADVRRVRQAIADAAH